MIACVSSSAKHSDEYFLQPGGVAKIHPLGPLTAEEEKLLEACLPDLKKNIEKGKAFVAQ